MGACCAKSKPAEDAEAEKKADDVEVPPQLQAVGDDAVVDEDALMFAYGGHGVADFDEWLAMYCDMAIEKGMHKGMGRRRCSAAVRSAVSLFQDCPRGRSPGSLLPNFS